MLLNTFTFHTPKTIREWTGLHGKLENAKLQAGGTFLLNQLKLLKRNGVKTPQHIISLQKIDELKGISIEGNSLIIKSMTTISDIYANNDVVKNLPVLKLVCKNISTQPIRNMATIGGNLTCRYTWTEMPAVAIGLGAKLHFVDESLQEHIIDPEDFFKNAAKTEQLLTKISFPLDSTAKVSYRRVKKSQFVDIPLLSLIIRTNVHGKSFKNTRVALNNCVEFAQRDSALEEFLNTQSISKKLAEEALDHITETIYDKRSSDYKKHMFRVSLKQAITELVGDT
ncbi:MAG: FAD binding domain-containing protein [Candidatus Omnitrophica bacterium]|nr:FAD binding domain-containing protein [Candidatus Omnitrophota bacterium]